ncbi:protein-disulfide reductase DsbD family protein [Pseudodesulfovibrio indicus]|uniref:Cytochrome C biogenesis protein n=1 Tax=Pseudodesulfovibrio indicus TaxID=1716143 RepID=A0A126QPG3_9BACT|nr:cytochrome c biogenesis protein CcdA [Pseudodesulfovibrio indicus]AMK11637.1 cytochrome C biogenesis protein [Pseudodesulfovibrio indicus]TDT90047.1 thiol:disulfide interchange protein DsbD [Pseudodesulfovibrio indicus]
MSLTKPLFSLFLTIALLLSASPGKAQIQPSSLAMTTAVQAYSLEPRTFGADFPGAVILALTLNIEEGWYAYSNIPGETGKPTRLTATAANGTTLKVLYPKGKEKPDTYDPTILVAAYTNGTTLFVVVPDTVRPAFPVAMKLDLLLCHPTKCVPARVELTYGEDGLDRATLPQAPSQPWWAEFRQMAQNTETIQTLAADAADEAERAIVDWRFDPVYFQPGLEVGGLLSAVLMGLLAGLILNIMPCVLPVVSLKLTALLGTGAKGGSDPIRAFREHNVFFVLGVLTFFLILAAVLGWTGSAWGALFQNRWLVMTVAGVMGALALSLFGLFHLPVIDLKFGAGHANPRKQAFFTGMLTTLLATPCSGPFLGGVLGWSLIQGPLVITTVFISIGLGMSAPYLLLIANPGLSRFLPRSGPWIEYVEKGIAFFLLATAFYLVGIALGGQSARLLAPLWVILFGGWLWVRTRTAKQTTQLILRTTILVLLAMSVYWTTPAPVESDPWEPFDPVALNAELGKGNFLVEFTADWCPTCKVLEATVMTRDNVTAWKERYGIRFVKVDMTERDPEAEAFLAALGSRSLPTAAVFRADNRNAPVVIRDLYTADQLERLLGSL